MRPRVLIVNDDSDLCEMLVQLLTDEGFHTDVAINGQDGLDKAHDNPPRVIVLDMTMPVMEGWAFRAHQRYCVTLAAIPVVILSGVSPARLIVVDVAAALQKPFHKDELIAAIRAHCSPSNISFSSVSKSDSPVTMFCTPKAWAWHQLVGA